MKKDISDPAEARVDEAAVSAPKKKKRILLLGATGSIGTQTLDVIRQHSDDFELIGVAAGRSRDRLEAVIREFPSVCMAGLRDSEDGELAGKPLYGGKDAMIRLIADLEYDLLVNAAVGFAGLAPTLASLEKGRDVALANKESLVCGGDLVTTLLKKTGTRLYPIDSEHSAVFQCLQGSRKEDVRRLIITASGGSLRDLSRAELKDVTVERALAHPNWKMGSRITIDSATMVNKGFEVIEAHYLFDIPFEKISTVLHPQSIVHSMVEYNDNAVIAQLGSADMRLPIQYALLYPDRPVLHEDRPLDMSRTLSLDFKEMDFERFPMLKTVCEAGRTGGNRGCVVNGADEQAIALFLERKIPFTAIEEAISAALEAIPNEISPDYAALERADRAARDFVKQYAEKLEEK